MEYILFFTHFGMFLFGYFLAKRSYKNHLLITKQQLKDMLTRERERPIITRVYKPPVPDNTDEP